MSSLIAFQNKLTQFLITLSDNKYALQKINDALIVINRLSQHSIPNKKIDHLFFTEKQILADTRLMALDDLLSEFRQLLITEFGVWFVPNYLWLHDLKQFINNRRTLEIMAGNGLISAGLRQLGCPITAIDNFKWQCQDVNAPNLWTNVIQEEALMALKKYQYDVIIMSWAPDTNDDDFSILNYLKKHEFSGDFIVIGEPFGHTNSSQFWQSAKLNKNELLNKNYHSFDTIDDHIYLIT
ncbi:methyltransferase domain-containing protein [Leuconostoc palmae]|uniref:SAM-dependent methyltransferase n=1 Tax=Leuconostoc palmae TaxID=501487 RepID=UPI001C7CB264|nr:SAM-dependent methyltransferase [Leuconostoc palmae]